MLIPTPIQEVLLVLRQDSGGNIVSSCGLAARFLLLLASACGLLVIQSIADTHPPYKKFFWSCRKILVAILSVLVVLRQDSCGNLVSSCGLAARFLLHLASSCGLLVI